MKTISTRDFWKLFSTKEFVYQGNDKLPDLLNFRLFLDGLFGVLAKHKPIEKKQEQCLIECRECEYIKNDSRNDICETHIGIIQGQLLKIYSREFSGEKIINDDLCIIKFRGVSSASK